MYQFRKAIVLPRTIGSQWQEVDIQNNLVFQVFTDYSKIYLVLYHPILDQEVFVDMDTLKSEYSSFNDTINVMLLDIGNRTLDTVSELPNTKVKYAKYSDAIYAEYKIEPVIAGVVVPTATYPSVEYTDLKVTRPKYNTDMSLLHNNCLLSVNGYFHMTDTDGEAAYVYDGAVTMRKSKLAHMGIWSFLDIGNLKKVRIDRESIVPLNEDSTLRDKITFTTDEDLENKSYFLILGGYIVLPDEGIFWRNGDTSFTLDLNRLPYIERLYESGLSIDLSSLNLTDSTLAENLINTDEVWSDEVIKSYLTLSQTFLVIVDIPYIVSKKVHIRNSNLPGMFTCYQNPTYPLIVGHGRTAEYWKTEEDGHWSVTVQDAYYRDYVLRTKPIKQFVNVNDHLINNRIYEHGRGFLLEIAGYDSI